MKIFHRKFLFIFFQHPWLLRPHFIDRWKKQQKKNKDEEEIIDPFFNDIIAGLSDDEEAGAVEDEPQKKQTISNKRTSTKIVF